MSREFDELLSAYLDGEVSPEERAAVERRLEQSPQLRETLDELSEVGDLIRGLPKPRAPIDLPERVVAAISPRPLANAAVATKKHPLFGTWPLVATGTVLAACVTIVVLMPRRPNADNLAVNAPRSGGEPAITAASSDLDLYGASRPAVDFADGGVSRDGAAETTESLTEYLRKLGRKPIPGEVYKTLEDNAGRTLVRQYTVVDTSEVANRMRTILINNSMNVIETETPLPQRGINVVNDASDMLVWYVEGPPQQVGRALDELESLSAVREVRDLGVLAESDSEPATTELFFDSAGKPATDFGLITPKVTPGDQPAPEAKPPASDPAPALEPAAPFATNGLADAERAKEAKLGDRLDLKAAEVQNVPTPAPVIAGAARGEVERRSTSVAAQPTTNFLGVSTQLDSNAPIVQDVLRSRAYGNSVSGNAAQGAAAPGNSAQRSAAGQFQDNFWRFKNLQQSNEDLNRKLNEAGVGQQQDKTDAGKEVMLKQQAGTAGRTATGSPVEFEAVVANPQAVPSQVHLLLILEPQAPQPAAPPAVTAPTPAKKAGD